MATNLFHFPVRKKETVDNKSHRDGKRGFVCLLVLRFQRALTNILLPGERSQDAFNFPRWRNNNSRTTALFLFWTWSILCRFWRFLVDTTEALVTVGRIWQVVNIVVATVEHLDWGWIVLGVAWTLKVNCSRNNPLGHSWVPVKQVTWGIWAQDMMLPFGIDFKFLTEHFAVLKLQMFFCDTNPNKQFRSVLFQA